MTRLLRLVAGLLVVAITTGITTVAAAQPLLRLHPPAIEQIDFQALSAILEDEVSVRLGRDESLAPGDDPIASLRDGSADLAIVDNTRPFESGLRAVLNLYTAVMHLSVRADLDVDAARAAGRTLRVELLPDSHAGRLIVDLLRERSARDHLNVEFWSGAGPGEPDLQLYLGPINPHNTAWFRKGFRLAALDTLEDPGAEFYIEGIRFLFPQFSHTRIPALTYTLPGNEQGIDALAVDMLLVSHRRVSPDLIYALAKSLIEQKARFAAVEPELFRWINSSFEIDDLAFPLHRGARMYMERDEPGFLERYAEALNFLVYVAALGVTGLVALGRWRARRRKERVDAFYLRILDLRRDLRRHEAGANLAALEAIEDDAFAALMDERLAADDSFRIFMELAEGLRREIKALPESAP
jgi:hypothetical protein